MITTRARFACIESIFVYALGKSFLNYTKIRWKAPCALMYVN